MFSAADCGKTWDLVPEYCEMEVDLPIGTWVEIYGVGWYQDGAKLWMPSDATIKYRAANVNKYVRNAWIDKKIDCTPLVPSFCEMEVDLPEGTWVEIYGVGWYQDGDRLWIPSGRLHSLSCGQRQQVRAQPLENQDL